MSLHFVFGASGAGKSYYIYQKIIRESIQNPKKQYLVLVPEQFTMQTQKELVRMHPRKGILNIDVLSFERLAFRVLEETGYLCEDVLEETGKSLVIRKVAQNHKKELSVLGEKMKRQGYISEMKSMVSELRQYEVSKEDMEKMLECAKDKPELYYKLKDIAVLYDGFFEYLEGKAITREEVLEVLGSVAGKSKKLKESILVLDGYTGFTPIQQNVLEKILPLCEEMYVTVTIGEGERPYVQSDATNLFYLSKQTVSRLCQTASRVGCPVDDVKIKGNARFFHQPALAFLEQNLFRSKRNCYTERQDSIRVLECANPKEEMEYVSGMIHRMVRQKKMRWRDFAVITADMDTYADYAKKMLERYEIPCFIDEKQTVLMNPFIEFLRACIDMLIENYSYESVFRFLRCGLLDLTEEEMDVLENYMLGMGIKSWKKWQKEWTLAYRGENPEEVVKIEALRVRLMELLEGFTLRMKVRKATVSERVRAFYEFIVSCRIQQKLKKSEQYFEAHGEVGKAKEYSQIYAIVMDLFDKMVQVLGEESVSLREFKELLEAGLSEAKVGIIPPSTDQVLVGDMERTRLKDIQVLFFVGVNDGKIPREDGGGKILSELNREDLKLSEVALAPTAKENLYTQKFYLYLNLTKPSNQLFLSYSKQGADGEAILPSFLIGNLRKMFADLPVEKVRQNDSFAFEKTEQAFAYLAKGFQNIRKETPSKYWQELFLWFVSQEEWQERVKGLMKSAFPKKIADNIGRSVAKALYGQILENSATRLELFAKCACAHFLSYGLELKERTAYEFNAMEMGNVLHSGLERFARHIKEQGVEWDEISLEEMEKLADSCVEEAVDSYGNTVLQSDARNAYMVNRVKRMMRRTVWALAKQMEQGEFKPSRFEVSFAMADSLESVNIALSEEETMKLKGRIDRVDVCEDSENVYVKVIDYKSGSTAFDLVALYHGLQLQLVLYLNAAMELEQRAHPDKNVLPAGIFYYNIKDPIVDCVEKESEESLNQRLLKQLRMNGLASADPEILKRLDKGLEEKGVSSNSIPVSINKSGGLSKTSSAVDEEHFELVSGYVKHKIQEIGQRILKGEASVSPYEMGQRNACQYCPYQGACGFDEKKEGCGYRRLAQVKSEEIWKGMEEQMQESEKAENEKGEKK